MAGGRSHPEKAEEVVRDTGADIGRWAAVDSDIERRAGDACGGHGDGVLLVAHRLVFEGEEMAAGGVDVGVPLRDVYDLYSGHPANPEGGTDARARLHQAFRAEALQQSARTLRPCLSECDRSVTIQGRGRPRMPLKCR